MLELVNHSNFAGKLYVGVDQQNQQQLTCVIKGTWRFNLDGNLKLQKALPIEEFDQYYGDPANSSLKTAHEIMPYKQGSEVLLYGTAQPINENSTVADVSIKIEWPDYKWEKQLYVFGPRKWQSILMGFIPGKPDILKPLPLRYEFAYGGQDQKGKKNFYSLNPAGQGFTESNGYKNLPMPQIENILINKVSDRPIPAGFGPIPAGWCIKEPKSKSSEVITHVAPKDQNFIRNFLGGEKIFLKNLILNKSKNICLLSLPKLKPKLHLYKDEQLSSLNPSCDMLIIDTDKMLLNMVWRIGIRWKVDDPTEEGILLIR